VGSSEHLLREHMLRSLERSESIPSVPPFLLALRMGNHLGVSFNMAR